VAVCERERGKRGRRCGGWHLLKQRRGEAGEGVGPGMPHDGGRRREGGAGWPTRCGRG
jgi:hypothetical protein